MSADVAALVQSASRLFFFEPCGPSPVTYTYACSD